MQSISFSENLINKAYADTCQSLSRIKSKAKNCKECNLCETASQTVNSVHRGDITKIDYFLLGEAPGKTEDTIGKPFVGKAGVLLQGLLQELEMTDNLYVTNVVKHRPPQNRKPTAEEMSICGDLFLKNEINVIKPKTIICLGRTAAEYLITASLKSNDIPEEPYLKRSLRGRSFTFNHIPVLCTWHPAYILRNPEKLEELKGDLNSAKEFIKK